MQGLNLIRSGMKKETFYEEQGLTKKEFHERERLLELQKDSTRWFSQEEWLRLKELSAKMNISNDELTKNTKLIN